jgi:hypothetical protein
MVSGIGSVSGIDALQRRLSLGDRPARLHAALAAEAGAIADAASASLRDQHPDATGALARSVTVSDESTGDQIGFAIGTTDPVGRYLEFGTRRMAAVPWLLPALRRRADAVRQAVASAVGVFKTTGP